MHISLKKTFVLVFLLIIVLPVSAISDDTKARAIMDKVMDRDDGNHQTADMTMILMDKNKNKRVRQMKFYAKDQGRDSQMMIFFMSPSDVKDTAFLTHDFNDPKKDDNQWLYLPSLKKTKRIASSNKSGSFMGSDLNYSDMARLALSEYEFEFHEKQKEVKINGQDVWVIWSYPVSDKIADKNGYKKALFLVRKDNFIVTRSIAWEVKKGFQKFFQAKKIEKIDGIWVVTHLLVTRKNQGAVVHNTTLTKNHIKFNQDLGDDLFTARQMEKGIPQ